MAAKCYTWWLYFFYVMSLMDEQEVFMPYVGSNSRLNVATGVAEIIPLTESLETEYSNKIFKANLLFWRESTGLLYLSDGVNSLSHLDPVTKDALDALNAHINDTDMHIDADLKSRIQSALANISALSSNVNTLSDSVGTHLNDSNIHVPASVIASTYATKQELAALNGTSGVYVTREELEEHTLDPDIHVSSTTIADTYATKQEVEALGDVYTTKTSFNNHVNNANVHITAADKALIESIGDSASISSANLDDMLVSLYS
jgi:hypothetical protein